MFLIPWIIFIIISYVIVKSIFLFIRGKNIQLKFELRESRFSTELFIALIIIYITVIIGFGLIYFVLSFEGLILVENGELQQVNVLESLMNSIYFSGVTMLTIGYGDITPIGIGRFIAMIEALIGYILPTAFVMKLIQSRGGERSKLGE
ncbi:potassium channel family protein [Oceanobacillus salinisoli]|uniref:potassium channel family protein n=1 Tax=Oceanobacillus salinisoli TaxID=2678611 RepID=UPI0012E21056|nr:potassium channel family protein [Oceanobacillus salinisoli]